MPRSVLLVWFFGFFLSKNLKFKDELGWNPPSVPAREQKSVAGWDSEHRAATPFALLRAGAGDQHGGVSYWWHLNCFSWSLMIAVHYVP